MQRRLEQLSSNHEHTVRGTQKRQEMLTDNNLTSDRSLSQTLASPCCASAQDPLAIGGGGLHACQIIILSGGLYPKSRLINYLLPRHSATQINLVVVEQNPHAQRSGSCPIRLFDLWVSLGPTLWELSTRHTCPLGASRGPPMEIPSAYDRSTQP